MQPILLFMKTKFKEVFVLFLPLFLYLIPIDWLVSRPTICPFNILFHTECYGCGITRAIFATMHLDFEKAYHFNKLIVFVFPLLVYIWVKNLRTLMRDRFQYKIND